MREPRFRGAATAEAGAVDGSGPVKAAGRLWPGCFGPSRVARPPTARKALNLLTTHLTFQGRTPTTKLNRDHDREQKRALKYGLEILYGATTLVASNQAPHARVLC